MTGALPTADTVLIKDAPYLTLTGELWGFYWGFSRILTVLQWHRTVFPQHTITYPFTFFFRAYTKTVVHSLLMSRGNYALVACHRLLLLYEPSISSPGKSFSKMESGNVVVKANHYMFILMCWFALSLLIIDVTFIQFWEKMVQKTNVKYYQFYIKKIYIYNLLEK